MTAKALLLPAVLALWCGLAATARAADPLDLLPATEPHVETLAGGGRLLVWQVADRGDSGRPLTLVALVLPAGAADWRVVPLDRTAGRHDSMSAAACPGAVAVSSGGFFVAMDDGGFQPLGLAVGDGVELSPFAPRRYGGVLLRQGTESAIVPLADFGAPDGLDQALQSSPIVVAQGTNDMARDDGRLANRIAIGLDGAGGLVAIGAFRDGGGAVSLWTFAELILALDRLAGIAVSEALALDGGSSAQLWLPAGDRHWGSPRSGYMPNALCLG